jgi:hypothetical protein
VIDYSGVDLWRYDVDEQRHTGRRYLCAEDAANEYVRRRVALETVQAIDYVQLSTTPSRSKMSGRSRMGIGGRTAAHLDRLHELEAALTDAHARCRANRWTVWGRHRIGGETLEDLARESDRTTNAIAGWIRSVDGAIETALAEHDLLITGRPRAYFVRCHDKDRFY